MPFFKFRAVHAKTGKPMKFHISLGGKNRGYTSDKSADHWLMVKTDHEGNYSWYAKEDSKIIESGTSSGGEIIIAYVPKD
jgi:hypothetical protein